MVRIGTVILIFFFTSIAYSQIVITEIMQNPSDVSDTNGEWFELFNASGSTVDINDWVISDNGGASHTIDNGGPLNIPAGGFLVLGRNGITSTNGDVPIDYVYSGTSLTNGDDEIILTDDSVIPVEIDRVGRDGG